MSGICDQGGDCWCLNAITGMITFGSWRRCIWLWAFLIFLFAWLGLLCFFIPLIMASTFGTKSYCNKYCGRGQLFELIGNSWKLSPKRDIPSWMRSHTFRYGFLLFFTTMFVNMLVSTYLVFTHAIYFHKTVSLLWTFDVPWHWAYSGGAQPWVAQFAFGFTASCWPPAFSVSSRCCCSSRVPGAFIALWAR